MNPPIPPPIDNSDAHTHESKAKTRKEMAYDLGLSISTFYRKLKEVGYQNKTGLLTPKQQAKIIKLLGY